MKQLKFLFILSLFGMLVSCGFVTRTLSSAHNDELLKTEEGYIYQHHIKNEGSVPKMGEYVYFHVHLRNGDRLMNSSRPVRHGTPKYQIPDSSDTLSFYKPKRKPFYFGALTMMSKGDSLTLFYPIDSIPTNQKPKGFENADFMTYDIVLLDILSKEEQKEKEERAERKKIERTTFFKNRELEVELHIKKLGNQYRFDSLEKELQTTNTGLKYIIHNDGDGELALPKQTVSVHYYCALIDGTEFDNSYKTKHTFNFPIGAGQVIKGWDEGIALLKKGSKATFFIPAHLAYGKVGYPPKIPSNTELIYYIEVEDIKD